MTERPNMHQRIPTHDIYKRLWFDMNFIQYFTLFFNITDFILSINVLVNNYFEI